MAKLYSDAECFAILETFRKRHTHLYTDPDFTGASVRVDDDGEVRFAVYSLSGTLAASVNVVNYTFDGEARQIDVVSDVRPKFRGLAGFNDGEAVDEPRSMFSGTGGWSVFLDLGGGFMPLVCVSNWHVLCQVDGNATQTGIPINLNSFGATLFNYNGVYEGQPNRWDFALARYNNNGDRGTSMRPCNDGTTHPRPLALSTNVLLNDGAVYRKIGDGVSGQICLPGKLKEIADCNVDMSIGPGFGTQKGFWFIDQLLFEAMASSGDSGSLIARTSDNTATGLLFASVTMPNGRRRTAANPIYRRPWRPHGVVSHNGGDVPIFEAPDIAEMFSAPKASTQSGGGSFTNTIGMADTNAIGRAEPISFNRSVLIGYGILQDLGSPSLPLIIRGGDIPGGSYWINEPPANNVGGASDRISILVHAEIGTGPTGRNKGFYAVFEPIG